MHCWIRMLWTKIELKTIENIWPVEIRIWWTIELEHLKWTKIKENYCNSNLIRTKKSLNNKNCFVLRERKKNFIFVRKCHTCTHGHQYMHARAHSYAYKHLKHTHTDTVGMTVLLLLPPHCVVRRTETSMRLTVRSIHHAINSANTKSPTSADRNNIFLSLSVCSIFLYLFVLFRQITLRIDKV